MINRDIAGLILSLYIHRRIIGSLQILTCIYLPTVHYTLHTRPSTIATMRFLYLTLLLITLTVYAAALPSSRKGHPPFRQSSRGVGYLVARDSEKSTRAMLGSWGGRFYQEPVQGANESKLEAHRAKVDALLLCQQDCSRIWNPAHPSQFWSDCNECCRKIGDAVAYC
ncbi:hypothetical protein DFP73DRAFT_533846 [Morchella snyderi]|nr:hypothetical protein DFP73DRAFT_533846 [Morchella snyderi]